MSIVKGRQPERAGYTNSLYLDLAEHRFLRWDSTVFLVPVTSRRGATDWWTAFSISLRADGPKNRAFRLDQFKSLMASIHGRKAIRSMDVTRGWKCTSERLAELRSRPVTERVFGRNRVRWSEVYESIYLPPALGERELLRTARTYFIARWEAIDRQFDELETRRGTPSASEPYERILRGTRAKVSDTHSWLQKSFRGWYGQNNPNGYRTRDIELDVGVAALSIDAMVVDRNGEPCAIVEVKPTRVEVREAIGQLIEYAAALQTKDVRRLILAVGEPLGRRELRTIEYLGSRTTGRLALEAYGMDEEGKWHREFPSRGA